MNRAIYFASVVVALISLFLVQTVGGFPPAAASVSSQSVPNPDSAAAPDSNSTAIDALASWPAGAGR